MKNENFVLAGRGTLWAFRKGIIRPEKDLRSEMRLALAGGHLVDRIVTPNLVVTAGKGLVGDLMIGDESSGLGYFGIGTGDTTPVVGNTTINTEVERKAFATMDRTGSEISLSVFFTAAECTYAIEECGIFGGSTATLTEDTGTLFSHYLQSYDNSGGIYDITFDYTLTIG
jgi:hypothetical protein